MYSANVEMLDYLVEKLGLERRDLVIALEQYATYEKERPTKLKNQSVVEWVSRQITRTLSDPESTPVEEIIACSFSDHVEFLIDSGALDGPTTLMYAVTFGNYECAQKIVERGFKSAHFLFSDNVNMMKVLLDNGVMSLESRAPDGNTLLHLAARSSFVDMIKFLIARGADVEAKNNDGKTPLDCVPFYKMSQLRDLFYTCIDSVE